MAGGLVTPVFVGRERELALFDDALTRCSAGDAATVLVGGEAGVGKTRLVEEASGRAGPLGFEVLVGQCIELGTEGPPLSPLVDILRGVVRRTPRASLDDLLGPAREELSRLLPELAAEPGLRERWEGTRTSQLLELVLGLIERLSAAAPTMLVVEDLQWADHSTLELTAFLVRSLRNVPVLFVGTFRSDEIHRGHPLRSLLAGWERIRSVRRIEVPRFDREEVRAQLGALLTAPPRANVVEDIYERSEGNAFLVEELAGVLEAGGSPGDLPPSLRDVLLTRMEVLSEQAQVVLRAASVAGRWVSEPLLAAVCGLEEASLFAALRESVERHLLVVDDAGRGYAFRHALFRDAVYGELLPGERVGLHSAYARALSAAPVGVDAATLASNLAYHAYAAHDLPVALAASLEAAREATRRFAPAEAQAHFERVLELWPAVPDAESRTGLDQLEVIGLAAEASYRAGDIARTRGLLDQALAQPAAQADIERQARLLEARSRVDYLSGRAHAALDDLRRAVELVPDSPLRAVRALVLASLAHAESTASDLEAASRHAREALEVAQATGGGPYEADAMITLGTVMLRLDDTEEATDLLRAGLERSRAFPDPETILRGHINLSDALEQAGRHRESIETARAGIEVAAKVGMVRQLGAYLSGNEIEPLCRMGEFAAANNRIDAALAGGPTGLAAATVLLWRMYIAVHTGDLVNAEHDAAELRRLIGERPPDQFSIHFAELEATRLLATGDLRGARAVVFSIIEQPDDLAMWARYAWPLMWVGVRVEADLSQRDGDREVSSRTKRLRAMTDRLPVQAYSTAANRAVIDAEAARALGEDGVGAWEAAVDAWGQTEDIWPLAYCRFRLAEAVVSAGRAADAAQPGGEALMVAEQIGARPLGDEVRALLRRARLMPVAEPAAAPGPASRLGQLGLTEREREVLAHVAAGRSNSEIAGLLYISPKTASVHVSNILSKLGASGRVEAAAIAHRLGITGPE